MQALVCGVIGGMGGLIVEVLLFIIKGSQIDAAAERARKRAAAKQAKQLSAPEAKRLLAEAERELAAAAATAAPESAGEAVGLVEDSAAGVGLDVKKNQ